MKWYRIVYATLGLHRGQKAWFEDIIYAQGSSASDAFKRIQGSLPGTTKFVARGSRKCTLKQLHLLYPEGSPVQLCHLNDYAKFCAAATENESKEAAA